VAWLTTRITTPALLLVVLLAGFGLILGCAIGAGELLELAERADRSTSFDSSITAWVVAHRTSGLTTLARFMSTLGSQAVLLPLTAVVTVALVARRQLLPAGVLVASWGGALGLYSLTKHFVHRTRPPMDIWLTDVGKTTSFPSGHATQSMGTLLALALVGAVWLSGVRRALLVLALVLAVGVGWSRVYLGVHWTTDVLAGWLIGAAWVTIVVRLVGHHPTGTGTVHSAPVLRRNASTAASSVGKKCSGSSGPMSS
jgi:membrane-associated phospholipid phosphatase